MHELAIAEEIVRRIREFSRERGLSGIEAATIKIGALQPVSHESLRFSLGAAVAGTEMEGVRFGLQRVGAVIECRACGNRSPMEEFMLRCPACGGHDVAVVAGKELFIDSIEVAEGEEKGNETTGNG